MKVSDLMTKTPIAISPDAPLRLAIQLLHRYHLHSIIVVNEEDKVVGLLTYADLFQKLLPDYNEVMKDQNHWLNFESIVKRWRELIPLPVSEVMKTGVKTVSPLIPAVEAGALMNTHHVRQLPVTENGKLVGVISYEDITWGIFAKMCKSLADSED